MTVEFAVLYLPTDALYAEVARIPGLIDEIGRECRVLVMGPSLFPALLRTIHLGFITLALEQKADQIRDLLGATRTEMLKMDDVLERLAKQAGAFSNTIERARSRTRAVSRKLRGVEAVDSEHAGQLLELDAEMLAEAPAELTEECRPQLSSARRGKSSGTTVRQVALAGAFVGSSVASLPATEKKKVARFLDLALRPGAGRHGG